MLLKATLISVVALVAAALMAGPAMAIEPAGTVDLTKVRAKGPVKDVLLDKAPKLAGIAKATARASFADTAGRTITIDSTIPDADLNTVAAMLNSTYHGAEIVDLVVHVLRFSEIESACGSKDVRACYQASDPTRNGKGQLWFALDDPDWKHSLVHEYGHHMDNQLLNIAHLAAFELDADCGINGDGSRDWFFVRVISTGLSSRFGCRTNSWENLLPELFAEDFVALNGIIGWELTTATKPTSKALKAMKFDIDNGIKLAQTKLTKTIKRNRTYTKTVTTPNISFLYVYVSGAKGRNFDIWVYPHGKTKLWSKATTRGRNESYFDFIDVGKWDIKVSARGKTGKAKIRIELL